MSKQLNVFNKTGTRGDWAIGVQGGEVLVSSIKNWTEARDAAVAIALQQGYDTVILMKMNGTSANVPLGRKATHTVPEIAEGEALYVARIQRHLDDDGETKAQCTTLALAVKGLPRKAHDLNWARVEKDGFERHTLDDGRILSIEKTTK